MKEYVYKITSKYKKNENLLATLGFNPYKEEENKEASVYATRVILAKDSPFVCDLVKMIEKAYKSKDFTDKDREEYNDKVVDNKLNDKAIEDLTNATLCFYKDDGELFINIDGIEYHSHSDINKACPILVSRLLDIGAIYKKKVGLSYKNLK